MSVIERLSPPIDPVMAIETRGHVVDCETSRLTRMLTRVLRRHHITAPARVRLSVRGVGEPALVQVNVPFLDAPTRIQISGPRGFVATFAAERLDRKLARLAGRGESRYWPDPARLPLALVSRERPIVRRKVCDPIVTDLAEAAGIMDAMDYDAHLFVDDRTGEDAVVFWAGPFGVRLARQHQVHSQQSATLPMFTVQPRPAPRLTDQEAAARLCRYGLPFLFYNDPRGCRGRLMYRRYDGDLAVVVPAGSEVRDAAKALS
ncbi:sigma 54 modulation/S30EA ribosomal C-terminal domain-containing protein [Nocardia sp. CY41]|uniref:sigma 54 modulation/S30EA ribosomal C-terminal domain-containing protein n=1 Tax=Nocardia sp. CY41 TaxID=2608686 RepID=UPI001F40E65F|nr:sigma 54 modulation/S30EA ribosomal C-terminal domain-containing protein [Nocardia sp. CY41]